MDKEPKKKSDVEAEIAKIIRSIKNRVIQLNKVVEDKVRSSNARLRHH